MILGIDIGNSNIVFGFIKNSIINSMSRIVTDSTMSVYDYLKCLTSIFKNNNITADELEGVVISSVVQKLTPVISEVALIYTGYKPIIVNHKLKTGLIFKIDNPENLGSDRIADCAAVVYEYPLPAVIIDIGTATTISVLDKNAVFLGGAIAPGLRMSYDALCRNTSQLPFVSLEAPPNCIGKNTSECINSGIIIGTASMVDGMLERIEMALDTSVSAIATGGLSRYVAPNCMRKLILDDDLLLKGLGYIYDLNS